MTIEERIARLDEAMKPLRRSEDLSGWVSARQRQRAILVVGEELLLMLREERREMLEARR